MFFFFNDTATTEIYTLSLHDALPISARGRTAPNPNVGCLIVSAQAKIVGRGATAPGGRPHAEAVALERSEEHTSELQSRQYLVCRLLLEKKKTNAKQLSILKFKFTLT